MNSLLITAALAATLIPAGAFAQTQTQTDDAAEARMRGSIQTAIEAGVPVSMLESKIAEGKAKGIPMDRIAAAVEHRAEVLARVSAALNAREQPAQNGSGTTASEAAHARNAARAADRTAAVAELTAAADAYESGVSLGSIASLSARAGEKRGVALTVLADLIARGNTAPSKALARVQTALSRGDAALANLGASAAGHANATIPTARANAGANGSVKGKGNIPTVAGTAAGAAGAHIGH
jgi:hypothetical protein